MSVKAIRQSFTDATVLFIVVLPRAVNSGLTMGQKNCSIKDEDELTQIIGNYRVTSDIEWLNIKAEIDNRTNKSAYEDENSNSLDSFDASCRESGISVEDETNSIHKREFSDPFLRREMSQTKKVDTSSSEVDTDSLLSDPLGEGDVISTTTQYNCSEVVEETETLLTDSITQSVDIRISPRNSTVELINFQCDDFPTEFSLVADVEVKMDDCDDAFPSAVVKKDHLTNGEVAEEQLINFDDAEVVPMKKDIEISTNGVLVKDQNCSVVEKEFQQNVGTTLHFEHVSVKDIPPKSSAKKESRKSGNANTFSVESKIAQEIKEMKQREEDLRKMREMLSKEIPSKPVSNGNSDGGKTPKEPTKPNKEKSVRIKMEPEKITSPKAKTVNGNQNYNIASVFGHKRKEETPQKTEKKPSATPVQESPIEREIRIVKQREEELKREREQAMRIKMQLEACQQNQDLSDDEKETIDTFASVSLCSDSSFDSGSKLTQSGQFDENLSPVTMNNKINAMYCNSSNAGSICSLDSISQNERSNNFNGYMKAYSQNASKDCSHNNSMRSPSPDSSSSSSVSKMSFPFQKPGTLVQSKNVNMERFIASKGKQIVFKNASPIAPVGGSDYLEIKPPQVKKGDQPQRKFVSAATKIQSELQEMKEREEELKKERERLLGLNGQVSDLTPETKGINENKNSKDICSRPDFLENNNEIQDENEKEDGLVNQIRRRSTLIEEWERRIQKLGVQA